MAYSKGQIITMNLDGTNRDYRILKLNGNIAEVVCMSRTNELVSFASSGQTYEGGPLDAYLNTTWYNTLSATAKAAIVDKTFRPDSWYWSGSKGNPHYKGVYINNGTDVSYDVSLANASFGSQITRHVYALSIQDVIDYLGVTPEMVELDTTLTYNNIWKMFWNVNRPYSGMYPFWLRSVQGGLSSTAAGVVSASYGYLDYYNAAATRAVRPALTIDLSKIPPTGYSVIYHANGGIPTPTDLTGQTNLPSPLPTVSKSGYIFDGWYTDSTFTTPAVAGAAISANTDLYAKFTRNPITLDLSTIGLSAGSHSIQMRLSDDGVTKVDSELSNSVTYVEPVPTKTITTTLTNVTADPDNPTTIEVDGTATLVFTANTGYELPDSVTVTGATQSWNKATGTLTLSNPVDNVQVSIAGVLPQLDTPTNFTARGLTIEFDEVEYAEEYEVFANGVSIGEYTPSTWEYPVLDGNNLIITQVYNATQSGANITLE